MVKLLTLDLIRVGFCIVSGFERGIDTWHIRQYINIIGTSVAILGNGLDIYYPGGNHKLQDILLEKGAFYLNFFLVQNLFKLLILIV